MEVEEKEGGMLNNSVACTLLYIDESVDFGDNSHEAVKKRKSKNNSGVLVRNFLQLVGG